MCNRLRGSAVTYDVDKSQRLPLLAKGGEAVTSKLQQRHTRAEPQDGHDEDQSTHEVKRRDNKPAKDYPGGAANEKEEASQL
jgi:hypothetical protein